MADFGGLANMISMHNQEIVPTNKTSKTRTKSMMLQDGGGGNQIDSKLLAMLREHDVQADEYMEDQQQNNNNNSSKPYAQEETRYTVKLFSLFNFVFFSQLLVGW